MTSLGKKNAEQASSVVMTPAAMMTAQTEQAITMAKDSFEQVATRSREAMEQGMKTVNVVTEMTRGNVEAFLESSRAASSGLQVIAQEVTEYTKESMERTASAARAMTQARTAPELIKLQSEFARAEFVTAIAEYTKLSQTMFQTMSAIFEPLQKQALTAAQIKDLLRD
jgi:hypothetical protein